MGGGSTPEASSAPIEGAHPAHVEWYSRGAGSVKGRRCTQRGATSRANLAERSRELTPMDRRGGRKPGTMLPLCWGLDDVEDREACEVAARLARAG